MMSVCDMLETGREAHVSGEAKCVRFRGVTGAKDIVHLEGSLFITACSMPSSAVLTEAKAAQVGLFILSIEGSDLYRMVSPHQVLLEDYPSGVEFRPYTLAYHRSSRDLFVVNRGWSEGGERIDVFNLILPESEEGTAQKSYADYQVVAVYRRSVVSPLLLPGAVGSVLSLGREGVLFTVRSVAHPAEGYVRWRDLANIVISCFLFRRWSVIGYCPYGDSGAGCRIVSRGYFHAEGLSLDSVGRVWVNDVVARKLRVFRHRGEGVLALQKTVVLPRPVFGLQYDFAWNSMVLAATPRLLDSFAALQSPSTTAGTLTFLLDALTLETTPSLEIAGDQLSSITSAVLVPGANAILYGSASNSGVLLCEMGKKKR